MHTLARKRYTALVILLFVPAACFGTALVNINTADEAALETLPGIGPSKAAAIIGYRTENGPFAAIGDIENVSGIGPSTFANIEALITVGSAAAPAAPDADTATSTVPSGGAATYVPPPSSLAISAPETATAYLDVPLMLSALVTTGSGARDASAALAWNFGDGSVQTGSPVEKTYRYPGTYAVTVTASDGDAVAHAEITVTVANTDAQITAVSSEGITVKNASAAELDLSGWSLAAGGGTFRFPPGARILPGMSVLFPQAVTGLPVALDARLLYPDGTLADALDPAPAPEVKPDAPVARTTTVRGVESVASVSLPAHDIPTVVAPAALPEAEAAAGAPFAASASADVADAPGAAGLLHSPWTYGFLGVLTVAGGAFLIL